MARIPAEIPTDNGYGAIADQMALDGNVRLRAHILRAQKHSPDQYAEIVKLSGKTGLPKSVIGNNIDDVRSKSELSDFDYQQIATKNPRLAEWMMQPDNAALSRDNMEAMSFWEQSLAVGKDIGGALGSGGYRISSGALGAAAAPFGIASQVAKAGGVMTSPLSFAMGAFGDQIAGTLGVLGEEQKELGDTKFGQPQTFLGRGIKSGLQSVGAALPFILGGHISGGARFALGAMGTTAAGNEYLRGREAGLSPLLASTFGTFQGAFEVLTERTPASRLLEGMKVGSPLLKTIESILVPELVGEQAATILQDFTEWVYLRPDATLGDYLRERPGAAAETLVATLVAVGAMSGGARTITKTAEILDSRAQAKQVRAQAENQKNFFLAMGDAAKRDKLLKRMPEKAQEYIKRVTEGGDKTTVYVDPQAWQTLFQDAGPDAPAQAAADIAGMTTEQYQEAIALNRKIAVPMEKFATVIAPTQGLQTILNDITYDQNQPTANEADLIEKESEARAQEAEKALDEKDSSTQVFDDVLQQRIAMGTERTRAVHEATLMQSFYRTVAEREGLDPLELYQSHNFTVAAGDVPAAALEQPAADGSAPPRGGLSFTPLDKHGQRFFKMVMSGKADRSTFLHESGHMYLEVLGDLAQREGATEQTKQDYETLLKWFGVTDRSKIKMEHHEKFARGFEGYLFEGKAPSLSLKAAFSRFSEWLVGIYRSIKNINAPLNDEVRAVMDRMLTTEDEIRAAREDANVSESLITPELAEAAGLSDAEFKVLLSAAEAEHRSQKERLMQKLMAEIKRGKSEAYRDRAKVIKEEVTEQAKTNNVYAAILGLRDKAAQKIDRETLIELYGEKFVKDFPKGVVGEGIHPDIIAGQYGFQSGDEMVQAIAKARPFTDFLNGEVEKRLAAEFPSAMDDGSIGEEAAKIVRDDSSNEILLAELKALKRALAPVRAVKTKEASADTSARVAAFNTIPTLAAIRDTVKGMIPRYRVMDLSPDLYRRAAQKAGREAFEAASKKKWLEAAEAKQRQIYNNEMYRQVAKAQERAQKIASYMQRYNKKDVQAKVGKAGADYLEQILGLLEGYEFRKVTNKAITRRKSLLAWVRDQEAAGEPVNISQELLDQAGQKNWREATFAELNDLYDAVRHIEHLADTKNKLQYLRSSRDFNEYKRELIDSIRNNSKGPRDITVETGLPGERRKHTIGSFFASLRKAASIVREVDGFKDGGTFWEGIIQPVNDAGNEESKRSQQALKDFRQLWSVYSAKERKAMQRKAHNAALDMPLSKRGILAIALNWGNDYQREALLEGYAKRGWTREKVEQALEQLDKRDWDFVQSVWDYINTYWPEIEAKQRRVEGISSPKVERTAIATRHGLYQGGYYPISYDADQSQRSYEFKVEEHAKQLMNGSKGRATTRKGFTKARVGSGGMAIKLDPMVMFDHIRDVIHDLTHHETVRSVSKILGDKEIQSAIIESYGAEKLRQLNDWLRDVAGGDSVSIEDFESALSHIRAGVSISMMGFKFTTTAVQILGVTQAVARLGPKWVGRGIKRVAGDAASLENTAAWTREKSEMMQQRGLTMDREINDIRKQLDVKAKWKEWIDDYAFVPIIKMQQVIDVITFVSAYEKFMEQTNGDEVRAIALAEQSVIDTQGSGQIKDLAKIQRGSQFKKLWTVFYTFFNSLYNLSVESVKSKDLKNPKDIAALAGDFLLLYTIPAVLGDLMLGRGPDDDDEESWLKWIVAKHFEYMGGTIPGVREAVSAAVYSQGYQGPAGARLFAELGNLAEQVAQGEPDAAAFKAANRVGGILFHYPAAQIDITAEGIYKLASDEEDNPFVILNRAYGGE